MNGTLTSKLSLLVGQAFENFDLATFQDVNFLSVLEYKNNVVVYCSSRLLGVRRD